MMLTTVRRGRQFAGEGSAKRHAKDERDGAPTAERQAVKTCAPYDYSDAQRDKRLYHELECSVLLAKREAQKWL